MKFNSYRKMNSIENENKIRKIPKFKLISLSLLKVHPAVSSKAKDKDVCTCVPALFTSAT